MISLFPGSTKVAPHANGFLFNGYAVAMIEHSWIPIGRNENYKGYYGTTYGGISGFRDVAMMDVYCGVEIQTAAVRRVRYLGDTDPRFAKIDQNNMGAIGISVSGCDLVLHPAEYSTLTSDSVSYVESGDKAGNTYPADTVTFVSGRELGFLPDSNKVYVNLDASKFSGTNAFFRFTTNATASGSLSVYGLANGADAAWTADTINFANAPANDRSSGGVNLNQVYNGRSLYTVESAEADTTYQVDISGYVADMKQQGAERITLIITGSNLGYRVAGGVDFDTVTSVAVNKGKEDTHTIENGKYYVSSNVALNVLNPSVGSDPAKGAVLQFAPTNKYAYVNLYNTFDHILTSADVGKTYRISFDIKTDSPGYIYYGLSSKAKRASDAADYSNFYNFSRNQLTFTENDLDQWISVTYNVTITEQMLPALLYGGEAVASIKTVAGQTYTVDVTDYISGKENGKYIFALTSEEPSACRYLDLTFHIPNADITGNVTVGNGVATVTGAAGIRVEDVFGSGAAATPGETYTFSAVVKNTASSPATYTLAPVLPDGTAVSSVSETLAAGEQKVLTLTYTATEQDADHGLSALAISGGDCQIDDIIVTGATPVVLSGGMELSLETAQRPAYDVDVRSQVKLSGAAPVLQDNIALYYKANKTNLDGFGFTDPYLEVTFGGVKTVITDYTVNAEGTQYIFPFYNIAPNQKNDTITAVLYATYNGEVYAAKPRDYSIAQYCYTQLEKCTDDAYSELRTLLVDLLNYGAVSQQYTGHNTGAPANGDLTDAQKAWGTQASRAYESVQNNKYAVIDNLAVSWTGGGLVLNDSVVMRFKFTADTLDGLSFKIESAGRTWTITDVRVEGGVNYIYFRGLNAGQMREKVYVTAYRNGVAVSNTILYSIESYAAKNINATAPAYLGELVDAMMKYGDSAKAYITP